MGPGSHSPYWTQPEAVLARVGPNTIADATRMGAARLLLRQFESPLC